MQKLFVCLLCAAVAASLAGCGKGPKNGAKEGPNVTVQIPGTTATVGPRLPDNLPAYVEIYPGAEVVAVVSGMNDNKVSGMISLKTNAKIQDVVAFYRQADSKNGLTVKGEFATGNVETLSAESGEKLLGVVVTSGDGGETEIQLTYK